MSALGRRQRQNYKTNSPTPAAQAPALRRPARGRHGQEGSALVVAIFILALLIALAAAAGTAVRLRVHAARRGVAGLQQLYLAQAGVQMALAVLNQDQNTEDSLEDDWATLGDRGQMEYPLGSGFFRVQVVDTASRVDVNTATTEMLLKLPGIDDALADAILDWREAGDTPRPSGAKSDYYQGLPEPYLPREAPFQTVGELLLVRGMTPTLLYGPPQPPTDPTTSIESNLPLSELLTVASEVRNTSASGSARINLNTATADELQQAATGVLTPDQAQAIVDARQQRGSFRSVADLLDVPGITANQVKGLADYVTTNTATLLPGVVNVNTASDQILCTVPGITPDLATQIVNARDSDHGPFESVGDLLDPAYLSEAAWRQALPYLTTRSDMFLVRAIGRVPESPTVTAVEALVERSASTTTIVRWRRVPYAPGWIAWGWPRQATETADQMTTTFGSEGQATTTLGTTSQGTMRP